MSHFCCLTLLQMFHIKSTYVLMSEDGSIM